MHKLNLFVKRVFDIVSSILLSVLLIPLWVVVAILIKKDSKGPVFFKQERRTKSGRVFTMLKFRSMAVGTEKIGAGLFNYANDPRVTRVGRVLRDTSIDELPQLFNIIKGDMSVVGPRPCVTYELGDFDTLNNRYKKRFEVKAGLTGLAQLKGRNDISWDEKVGYDNRYVDDFNRIGVIADVKIIFGSILKVFKKEDIYENKADNNISDEKSAQLEEEKIIRMAHLPD